MPNKVVLRLAVACAVVGGGAAKVSAQSYVPEPACGSNVPRSLFFVASGEQSVYNKGISTAFDGGVLLGSGTADGPPVTPTLRTKADCVPLAQLGYFQHVGDSDWLWGVKFSYSYIGATLAEGLLAVPQAGTSTIPGIPSFPGVAVTRSYEVFVDHQMILAPFVGRSFNNGFLYVGAGPSLSRVGASLNDLVGFATFPEGSILPGLRDVSGAPQSDAGTQWAWGIAATVGATYFITPNCFLDLNYTFSNPFPRKFNVESSFRNEIYSPVVFEGTLIGDYTAKASTHSITLSINVGF
jgi:opacity protein-like surface antigen